MWCVVSKFSIPCCSKDVHVIFIYSSLYIKDYRICLDIQRIKSFHFTTGYWEQSVRSNSYGKTLCSLPIAVWLGDIDSAATWWMRLKPRQHQHCCHDFGHFWWPCSNASTLTSGFAAFGFTISVCSDHCTKMHHYWAADIGESPNKWMDRWITVLLNVSCPM